MNQSTGQPRSHPLRMMAADYDASTRDPGIQHAPRASLAHTTHRKGFGKGRKGSHHQNHPQSLSDFILPEMLQDPWVGLYSRLSVSVRERETKHLCKEDQMRVDSDVQFTPAAKRHNLE
jgi:hypothetical protein